MSTDSTELTFVRCPSCRSLVPAVSTRCRMCGSGIDTQGKEVSEPEAPRRARSNTISQPNTEFVNATEAVRASESAPVEMAPEAEDDFDPLREYLDEDQPPVAVPQSKPTTSEPARNTGPAYEMEPVPEPVVTAAPADPMFDDDDFDIFGDDDAGAEDDWLAPVAEEAPAPVQRKEVRPEPAAPAPVSEPVVVKAERAPAPQPHMNGGGHSGQNQQREAGRVVVESGSRPAGKPSGLSFGKGRQEEPAARPQQPVRDTKSEHKGAERSDKGGKPPHQKQAAPAVEKKPVEAKRETPPQNNQKQARPQPVPERGERQHAAPTMEVPRVRAEAARGPVQEAVDSRLVGWLVSFSTPTRSAIELREGKFFVGGNSLKPNDLVLEDPSISTPHAMVAVEAGRLQIQDLMSEAGVYRKRQGETDFTQFGEPFEVKHGDWIRFGNIDFLITMIPDNKR